MHTVWEGVRGSIALLIGGDREVYGIIFLSLRISLLSALIATVLGVPVGFLVAVKQFPGKRFVRILLNTLMGMPTVVIGLLLYTLICRQGPFGELGILFTPTAIVLGQVCLAMPIVAALTLAAVGEMHDPVRRTAKTLGATRVQAFWMVVRESRYALLVAFSAGFGRVIAEVGSAMMLGGNIRGSTRTMTTAIALETSKGKFGLALALGFVLLVVALSVNVAAQFGSERLK